MFDVCIFVCLCACYVRACVVVFGPGASEHGVEAVTLRGGKPVFSLALPQGGLYVDLNGDGVIDHLSVKKKAH